MPWWVAREAEKEKSPGICIRRGYCRVFGHVCTGGVDVGRGVWVSLCLKPGNAVQAGPDGTHRKKKT